MIDWAKPIETVPCERNPEPVPCLVVSGPDEDGGYKVDIIGEWLDADGGDEGGEGWGYFCQPSGEFLLLDGSVRNVATAEVVTAPTCPMCDDTVTKDYAGFAMDPCDHKPTLADAPKTLRDEFAMAALAAIIGGYTPEEAATYAYEFADAMMAERRKEPNA